MPYVITYPVTPKPPEPGTVVPRCLFPGTYGTKEEAESALILWAVQYPYLIGHMSIDQLDEE